MKYILSLLLLVTLSGCFFKAPLKNTSFLPSVSGGVLEPSYLKAGIKIGVLPFKAGSMAEANEQLDKISARLLKGISDGLESSKGLVTLTDDAAQADVLLEGYVQEFSTPGKFNRWVLRKNKINLGVQGELWRQDSGQKVLTFHSHQVLKLKDDHLEAAYLAGHAIGSFILGKIKE